MNGTMYPLSIFAFMAQTGVNLPFSLHVQNEIEGACTKYRRKIVLWRFEQNTGRKLGFKTVQHSCILFKTVQHSCILFKTVQHSCILFKTVQHSCIYLKQSNTAVFI
jgi:hypothetical protein